MSKNYRWVRAEGQEDGNLCWAACMAWFTRATKLPNREQNWIQTEFSRLWENQDGGTLTDDKMREFLNDALWRLYWESFGSGAELTLDVLKRYLEYGPVYVAYFDQTLNSKHVNIIYSIHGEGGNPQLGVMEPRFNMNGDGSFDGKHLRRTLSYYQAPGSRVFIACPQSKEH